MEHIAWQSLLIEFCVFVFIALLITTGLKIYTQRKIQQYDAQNTQAYSQQHDKE